MPGDIGDVVDALDDAIGVDEEGHPLRVVGIRVAIGANHVVRGGDLSVDIGQEPEAEVLRVGEDLVVLRGVVRSAEDEAVGVGEVVGPVTQGLPLESSNLGRSFRIPPQQDPVVP